MRLVLVEWHDANSRDGWQEEQKTDNEEVTVVKSAGWLRVHNKKKVVLVSHIASDPEEKGHGSIWTIPTGCIIRIVDLIENQNERESNPVQKVPRVRKRRAKAEGQEAQPTAQQGESHEKTNERH